MCGRADPFTRVVFLNQSQSTESLRKTICPTWDQTLVFDTVEIHGDPHSVADNPPKIIVEIFDYDSFVSYFIAVIKIHFASSKSFALLLAAYCTALEQWALAKLCGVEHKAPPIFGRATITLGIGRHSSLEYFETVICQNKCTADMRKLH